MQWISHKKDKAVKIMIKTQTLFWQTIEGNSRSRLGLRLGLGFFWFISNSHPLTHDVTCSVNLLGWKKNMRWQCQMNNLQYNKLNVKLSNLQLNKLKSGIKNGTEVTLKHSSNIVGDSNDGNNFPHKFLLTNTQFS